jgi:hypothetical protein
MITSTLSGRAADTDIAITLVPEAWAQACRAPGRAVTQPRAILPLKPQTPGRKSGVYQLEVLAAAETGCDA